MHLLLRRRCVGQWASNCIPWIELLLGGTYALPRTGPVLETSCSLHGTRHLLDTSCSGQGTGPVLGMACSRQDLCGSIASQLPGMQHVSSVSVRCTHRTHILHTRQLHRMCQFLTLGHSQVDSRVTCTLELLLTCLRHAARAWQNFRCATRCSCFVGYLIGIFLLLLLPLSSAAASVEACRCCCGLRRGCCCCCCSWGRAAATACCSCNTG